MVKLSYWGHSCFHLDDGTSGIVVDPFLTGNPKAAVRVADVPRLDAVLVSHGHQDHLGDAVELSKRHRAPVIAPFELAMFCQRRGADVHAMHIGGSHVFPFGRVKLTIAHHGSAFVDKTAEYTGSPCGFLLHFGGMVFYHAGDTGLFYDMKLLGEVDPIDVALLPIGDNFTMGPDDAARAVELLRPRVAVPMHYGTFDFLEPDATRFVALASGFGAAIVAMQVGDTREFA